MLKLIDIFSSKIKNKSHALIQLKTKNLSTDEMFVTNYVFTKHLENILQNDQTPPKKLKEIARKVDISLDFKSKTVSTGQLENQAQIILKHTSAKQKFTALPPNLQQEIKTVTPRYAQKRTEIAQKGSKIEPLQVLTQSIQVYLEEQKNEQETAKKLQANTKIKTIAQHQINSANLLRRDIKQNGERPNILPTGNQKITPQAEFLKITPPKEPLKINLDPQKSDLLTFQKKQQLALKTSQIKSALSKMTQIKSASDNLQAEKKQTQRQNIQQQQQNQQAEIIANLQKTAALGAKRQSRSMATTLLKTSLRGGSSGFTGKVLKGYALGGGVIAALASSAAIAYFSQTS